MKRTIISLGLAVCLLASCSNAPSDVTTASTAETTAVSETSAPVSEEPSETSGTEKKLSSIDEIPTFVLVSKSLEEGGTWPKVISKTDAGENKSPELSWTPVDGADQYVIYMVDETAGNWLHWKSEGVIATSLGLGWASSADYIGPYPPPGTTHVYTVYVIALKAPVERVKGLFNGNNPKFEEFFLALDTDAKGNTGNIISYGKISGEFTN